MTQPTLSAFFGKKGGSKRPLEEQEGNKAASAKEGTADAAATAAVAQQGASKKPALGGKSDDGDTTTTTTTTTTVVITTKQTVTTTIELSPELAAHPVLQPLAGMDDGWRQVVIAEAAKPYFGRLLQFLSQEAKSKQTVYPPYPLALNALSLCRWEDVRVVIIGQDPYHGPNQAHGLAFSVLPPTPPPPSLMNMYKEAMADVGIRKPTHGNLQSWSRQGVLLLNTVLTVRRGQAHSHKGRGWEQFTDAVIRELDKRKSGLVFLLWGKPAQEKCKAIDKRKHRLITCAHPSPLSATKTNQPFIESKCFSRCNQALAEQGKQPIDWNVL